MKPESITVSGDLGKYVATTSAISQWEQAPIEEPTVIEVEQRVFIQHWDCNHCYGGEMVSQSGITVGFNTYWNHKCNNCGHLASSTEAYPKTVYKAIKVK